MDEDVVAIAGFWITTIFLAFGIPLVRALSKKWERQATRPTYELQSIDDRLARIEQAVDAMAIEVERIAEGQRFTTKLLSDGTREPAALPAEGDNGAVPAGRPRTAAPGLEDRT